MSRRAPCVRTNDIKNRSEIIKQSYRIDASKGMRNSVIATVAGIALVPLTGGLSLFATLIGPITFIESLGVYAENN